MIVIINKFKNLIHVTAFLRIINKKSVCKFKTVFPEYLRFIRSIQAEILKLKFEVVLKLEKQFLFNLGRLVKGSRVKSVENK